MSSKKYSGKTCAYCARPGASTTRDHVVATKFFLREDRADIPIVPACAACNGEKSTLEHYAMSVLPFGSRHAEALRYTEEHMTRRLDKNAALRTRLSAEPSGLWEDHRGILVPTMSVPIETEKIQRLFSYVVRGLFMFHWKEALDPDWCADVTFIHPKFEAHVISRLAPYIGKPRAMANRDLGRGTVVYEGAQSEHLPQFSLWQFTLFGEMQFGGDPKLGALRLTRFYAVTRSAEAQAQGGERRMSLRTD